MGGGTENLIGRSNLSILHIQNTHLYGPKADQRFPDPTKILTNLAPLWIHKFTTGTKSWVTPPAAAHTSLTTGNYGMVWITHIQCMDDRPQHFY